MASTALGAAQPTPLTAIHKFANDTNHALTVVKFWREWSNDWILLKSALRSSQCVCLSTQSWAWECYVCHEWLTVNSVTIERCGNVCVWADGSIPVLKQIGHVRTHVVDSVKCLRLLTLTAAAYGEHPESELFIVSCFGVIRAMPVECVRSLAIFICEWHVYVVCATSQEDRRKCIEFTSQVKEIISHLYYDEEMPSSVRRQFETVPLTLCKRIHRCSLSFDCLMCVLFVILQYNGRCSTLILCMRRSQACMTLRLSWRCKHNRLFTQNSNCCRTFKGVRSFSFFCRLLTTHCIHSSQRTIRLCKSTKRIMSIYRLGYI